MRLRFFVLVKFLLVAGSFLLSAKLCEYNNYVLLAAVVFCVPESICGDVFAKIKLYNGKIPKFYWKKEICLLSMKGGDSDAVAADCNCSVSFQSSGEPFYNLLQSKKDIYKIDEFVYAPIIVQDSVMFFEQSSKINFFRFLCRELSKFGAQKIFYDEKTGVKDISVLCFRIGSDFFSSAICLCFEFAATYGFNEESLKIYRHGLFCCVCITFEQKNGYKPNRGPSAVICDYSSLFF